MKKVSAFLCSLALAASTISAAAQTADERAYQIAVDNNLCDDRSILEATFTDATETEIEVRCANGGFGGNGVAIAAGAAILLFGLAAGGGGDGGGDSTSDTQ